MCAESKLLFFQFSINTLKQSIKYLFRHNKNMNTHEINLIVCEWCRKSPATFGMEGLLFPLARAVAVAVKRDIAKRLDDSVSADPQQRIVELTWSEKIDEEATAIEGK